MVSRKENQPEELSALAMLSHSTVAPQRQIWTVTAAMIRVYQAVLKYFVGPDAFISYSRFDAFDYAGMLSSLLTQQRFTVFCDQAGTPPASEVPRQVLAAAYSASVMVIIGSPAAMASPNVLQELTAFGRTGRPVIPIVAVPDGISTSVEPARVPVAWQAYVEGLSISTEPLSSIRSGMPSEEIQRRIALAVGVNTQRRRLRRATVFTVAVFVLLLIGSLVTGLWLERSLGQVNAAQQELSKLGRKISDGEARLQQTQKELASAQDHVAESEVQVGKLSQLAEQETARAKEQKVAAAEAWSAVLPRFQELYPQPDLACKNGQLALAPPLVIHIQANWPVDGSQPKWPDAAKQLLSELADAYLACYPPDEKRPVLVLSGNVGSVVSEEGDTKILSLGPGMSTEYALKVGSRYANWVADALADLGIPKEKLYVVSYGKEKPIRIGSGFGPERMGLELLNNRVEVTLKQW